MTKYEKDKLSIGEAASFLNVSVDTLRRWDKAGLLAAKRLANGYRYYDRVDLEERLSQLDNLTALAKRWAMSETETPLQDRYYCPTHDIFIARSSKLRFDLEKAGFGEKIATLTDMVVGEIGNNSFDHNIGNWPDVPGIFFGYDLKKSEIILADRGQGILTTLRRVRRELSSDQEAIGIAFTLPISGRGAEKRGNGLKLVRQTVISNPFSLDFTSGTGKLELNQGDKDLNIQKSNISFHGCMAIIKILGK